MYICVVTVTKKASSGFSPSSALYYDTHINVQKTVEGRFNWLIAVEWTSMAKITLLGW